MEVCFSSQILAGVKLGNTDVRPAMNVTGQWRHWTSPYHVSCKVVAHALVFWQSRKFLYFKKSVKCRQELINSFSLRKHPTFVDAATGFPAKWRLRKERRNSTLMMRHYPDLGRRASDWMKQIINQLGAPPRSGYWHVISVEFLSLFPKFHFAVKSVVALRNVGSFLKLKFLLLKLLQHHNDAGSR